MDNEPTSAIINGDNTDTHSQVNEPADNTSRHSSRVGSSRSGRSKAASVREAFAIDDLDGRKPSEIVVTSPKPDVITNGDRQHSAVVKSKPQSPTAPVFDTHDGEYNDDLINQDDDYVKPEIHAIVRLINFYIFKFSFQI
jgi:hypothetical protein